MTETRGGVRCRLRHKDAAAFVGPHPTCEVYRQERVEQSRIIPSWPSCEIEQHDLHITGTFALPTDTSGLNHMGFIFRFGSGPKVYVTGDTDYTELLVSAAAHCPDVMITCINSGMNNLSHWEATDIAGKIKPRVAIPCHYDMFADNAADPKQFCASLKLRAPEVCYQELSSATPFVFFNES